ncbi:MAG: hypothetical protein J5593_04225, partial [Bacteroidaceae bacterium]|nr:hypothetical protein [Bacteroidaceae bacterium]
ELHSYVNDDHMVVFIAARSGSVSFHSLMNKLGATISTDFPNNSVMIIYPDQYGVEHHNVGFTTGLK